MLTQSTKCARSSGFLLSPFQEDIRKHHAASSSDEPTGRCEHDASDESTVTRNAGGSAQFMMFDYPVVEELKTELIKWIGNSPDSKEQSVGCVHDLRYSKCNGRRHKFFDAAFW
jgi:hypothetical protein